MFTTIITDCKKDNEAGRQITRFNSLGLGPSTLIGVESVFGDTPTIEAGANLVDILDASGGRGGVISVNVAPRGNKKEGTNGNLFCYFYYKKTLVISSTKGYILVFIKKFGVTDFVKILDTDRVLEFAISQNLLSRSKANYISHSQFRSYDFVPYIAKWILNGIKFPSKNLRLTSHNLQPISYNLSPTIWCVDAFGNCKTTLIKDDLSIKDDPLKEVSTNIDTFRFYNRLKDVPAGDTAIYTGSSGFMDQRFLEIATQAVPGSAAKKYNLKVGMQLKIR